MIKNILFDLDGTLLPLDMDDFIHTYFSAVIMKLVEAGHDPLSSKEGFLKGVDAMINNDGTMTIQDRFWTTFRPYSKLSKDDLEELYHQFYLNEFQACKEHSYPNEKINTVLKSLKEKGFRLFLTTNPLFPKIATQLRVKWAKLDEELFEEITTYEDYHYCKPNKEYFNEVLNRFNLNPEETLIVGNDAQEDLCGQELGIKTYLITDHLLDRSNGQYQTDYESNMEEFLEFLNNLE